MASATSSHGWANSCPPSTMSSATPVSASPMPMTSVPCAWSRRRSRTIPLDESAVARRARSANGSRIDGTNSATASTMCVTRSSGKNAGMATDCRRGGAGDPSAGLQSRRRASSATQSPSVVRSNTSRPAAANASRTSPSRSTKIPDARSVPTGRSSSRSDCASSTSSDAMRLARTMSNGPSPVGTDPRRAATSVATPFRRAFASVASTARGSVSTARTRAAPSFAAAIVRIPDPQPTSSTVALSTRPASALPSSAARQRRVVGCSPVPNAIPGSSSRTTSPGSARWRRQVGRMTIRRPIRSTGKCSFHASAQSPSATILVRSCPIGRRPNAWRCPSAWVVSATARSAAPASPAGTYPRTTAGRVPSTRAPSPSSTSSNAGSTLVPPVDTRARISVTASTASTSASTASSSHARPEAGTRAGSRAAATARFPSAERVSHPVEDPRPRPVPGQGFAALLREVLQQVALALGQLRRDDDVDEHVEVAAGPGASDVRDALAAQPDLRARLGPCLDLDLLVAVDGRDRDPRPERRLRDRHVGLVDELGALALELRMWRHVDGDVEAARRTAPRPRLALVRQTDLVSLVDPGRDRHPQGSGLLDAALPVTCRTGVLDDPAVAAAPRARRDIDHLAEHRLPHAPDFAAAVALRAADGHRARLRARAVARLAALQDGELNLLLRPADGLLERDPEVVAEVRPALRPTATSARRGATEKGVEDVAEPAEPRVSGARIAADPGRPNMS